MRLLERAITKYPLPIILALCAITAALLPGLLQLRFDVSAENFVPDTDIERVRYLQFVSDFGRDTFLLALFPVGDAFSDETLAAVKHLSEKLRGLHEVSSVYCLTDTVRVDHAGLVPEIVFLAQRLPLNEDQRRELREMVLSHPLYKRKVVSSDGRVLIVSIVLDAAIEESDRTRKAAVAWVKEVLRGESGGRSFELTGVPLLKTDISNAVHHDIIVLAPAVALVSMFFLWLAFRCLWALVAGAAAIGMTLIWTMSIFTQAGLTLNMATTLLPSLVMAISLAQIIFIIAQYQRSDGEPAERIGATVREATPPCFLAALTTAAGFSSLAATTVLPVREFGLMAALGIVFSFVVAILLVPALIRLRPRAIRSRSRGRKARWTSFLARLTYRRGWIAAVTLAVLIAGVLGILRVRIETSPYGFFPEEHPLNRARNFLQKEFGVASSIDLAIRRSDGSPVDGPALSQLASLRDRLMRHQLIGDTLSLLTIGGLLAGDEESFIELMGDGSNQAMRQTLTSVIRGNRLFSRYFSPDGRTARLTIMLREHSAERILAVLDFIESEASRIARDLDVLPTGQTVLFTKMVDDLFFSQVASIALILIFVTAVFVLAFRSFTVGLISLIPNVTPILLTLGLMGWFGIPLNVLTIMVASIAIGIAVDDTIHFMHHIRGRLAAGESYDEAIDGALQEKGRPILFTSLLLTAAFLTHLASSFLPTIYLGALTAMTMLWALVGDLVLLPALLRFFRPRFRLGKPERN